MEKIEPIEWQKEYELGNSFVDENHKKLVETINLLVDCINEKETHETFFSIFHRLAFYAEKHFANEEAFFKKNACPNMEAHQESHKEFISKLVEFQNEFEEKGQEVISRIFLFFKDWLEHHILTYDKCILANQSSGDNLIETNKIE